MANNQNFTLNIKALLDASDVKAKASEIQNAFKNLRLPDNLTKGLNDGFAGLNKALADYESRVAKGVKTKTDAKGLTASVDNIIKEFTKLENVAAKVKTELGNSVDLSKMVKFDDTTIQKINNLRQEIANLQKDMEQVAAKSGTALNDALGKIGTKGAKNAAAKAVEVFNTGNIEQAIELLKEAERRQQALIDARKHDEHNQPTDEYAFSEKTRLSAQANIQVFTEMREVMSGALADSAAKTDQLKSKTQELANTVQSATTAAVEGTDKASQGLTDEKRKVEDVRNGLEDAANAQAQFNKEIDQVKSRIQYFFGISNVINLVKRAIRGAVDTIKDLDRAMTETAVVTDFTVSDMWKQLPEYTKRANELGVTTQAAYEAATLYYQQGLNNEEVNALSVETLKMARIAGLDAAEATDRMTNALRGFNMELNTANAQRVDDVYSELAANTASNVDEISTAMTKVASLAHSANMEFETTAAFLAQIIETTRESAETAGTALKTVVARFSEVKKLVDTNQLKGQDEEGQIVDVNKVSSALRTAGIDLNKYFLGEVGLDDIFIELASKWDSLTSVQQRYIATQAAGSRQQSRFIALMQDYARTQELVGKAYNAEGASARQFAKTQESLESKLNRLKNAWNEFLMGLTNNVMVKTFVDLLTNLLNVVNKLTSAFGDGVGSILKWTAALGALGGLRKLFTDGGLAARAIGGLLSGGAANNKLRSLLGLGAFDQATGQYTSYTRDELRQNRGSTIIGGATNLGKSLWGGAQKLTSKVWGVSGAGNAALGAGGLIGGAEGLAAGLTGIATALGAVAVAVGAAIAIYKAWEKFSPEGQLKAAKREAEKANKEAQKAQEDYKALTSLQNTYKEKTEEVDKATSVSDRAAAIKERNEAILDAIKEDGTLAQYVITEQVDNEIILKVDEAGLAEAAKTATELAEKAAVNAYFKQANVNTKEAGVARSKLENILSGTGLFDTLAISNMSTDEIYKTILNNTSIIGEKQLSKAAELYGSYINSIGAAEQQVKLGYGKALAFAGASDELTNALLPVLSKLWADTGKQLTDAEITALGSRNELLPTLKAYSSGINTKEASLVNISLNNQDDLIRQALGLDNIQDLSKAYSDLETALGLQQGTVEKTIKSNLKLQKQQQEAVAKNTTLQMIQAGQYSPTSMAKYLSLDNFDNQQYIANLLESIGSSDFGSLLINPIIDAMKEGNWEDSALQQWVDSIDFSNPIQAFSTLNNAANGTNQQIKNIARQILETSDAQTQFSTSARLSYLLTSESYDALSESLGKFIETNGEITSGNIKELAESNKDLNALLEDNKFSAAGLAEILTHIEDGTLSVLDLNDALIAAASAMDDLDGIVKDTIDDLNSFDPGFNEGDITSFIQKAYKTISENLEAGAVGNNQNRTYLEKIFGPSIFDFGDISVEQYGAKYEQALNYYTGILEANQENMFSAWQGVAETFKSGAGEYNGLVEQVGDEIFIHAEEFGLNTEQLINVLAKYTGESDTWLRMMVTDFKNNSADFKYEMGKQDLPNALQAWYDALPQINGQKIYEEADFEKLGTLLGVGATAVKDAVKDIDQSAGTLTSIDWTAGTGEKSAKNYIEVIQSLGKQIRGVSGAEDWDGLINFQALADGVKDVGLEAQFSSIFNEIVAEEGKFTADFGRGLEVIELQAGETATAAAQRIKDEIANQKLAGAIGESIVSALADMDETEANITFLPNHEAVDEYIDENHDAKGTVIYGVDSSGPDAYEATEHIAYGKTIYTAVEENSSRAKGGKVSSYASGTNHLSPGPALTGEEGPEIVWNKEKGYAYITGESHPEFQNLQPGDRIFNAQETKKILGSNASGGLVPSFARGYGAANTAATKKSGSGSGSGGRGGSDDKTPDEWKNELDWLYNLMEDIAELERDQKAIEEQYEDYLADQTKTGGDLYRLLVKQLGNLYTQLNHQTFALEKREQEMREFMDITNDQDQYLWYNWQDRTLEIDWDAIDQIQDEELYKHVKELVDEAEEIQDKIDDADDSIMDITNQIQELENIWRDTFVDFEKRVLDAVIKFYQTVIDNYSELNDTLNDSNSQILDSLQKEINLQRQIRDNTKTEEEIADDEARLAYLRRDTSGGNELAAMQLQQQLDENRQNYEDSLVDQAISRLQEDNDAAAQQREKQIEIMQAQLDYQSENGEFNAYVSELLTSAMGADGELLTNSDLAELLKTQENWDAMSEVSKQVWDEELNGTFKEVAAFLLKQNAEENGTFYTALTAAVESVSTAIGSYSQAMTKLGSSISSAASGGYGGGSSGDFGGYSPSSSSTKSSGNFLDKIGNKITTTLNSWKSTATKSGGCFASGTKILMADNTIKNIEDIQIGEYVIAYDEDNLIFTPKEVVKAYIHYNTPAMIRLYFDNNEILDLTPGHPIYSLNGWKSLDIENSLYEHGTIATLLKVGDVIVGINGNRIVTKIEELKIGFNYNSYNIEVADCHTFLANGLVAHNAKIMGAYATGGLASSTGLAWLDGTPSEPEYVLNARQTDAFLKLADILPSMMGTGTNTTANSFGNNQFNISVNVDQISSDYDVDRMVDRIKDKLYDSASYRNINTLSFLR